jgi:hypothetical protein
MLSLKYELPLWRKVSKELDELYTSKKVSEDVQTCSFYGKSRVRTLETMDGPCVYLNIGSFTCRSCRENWSVKIGG